LRIYRQKWTDKLRAAEKRLITSRAWTYINKRKLRRTRGKIFHPLSQLGQNCNRAQKYNFHTLQHIFKWTIKCPQHEGDASQEERPLLARKSRAMFHQSRIVNCQPPGARALRSVDRGPPRPGAGTWRISSNYCTSYEYFRRRYYLPVFCTRERVRG